jgi:queuine tRNA-ribosyltransferase
MVEAEALYVQQSRLSERLQAADRSPLTLFDIGLGAGSNALAAWHASEQAPMSAARLQLISFERDLGALELALAHGPEFSIVGESALAAQALLTHGHHETPRTTWRLWKGDVIECLERESSLADIVFWDPFSPHANPVLWTIAAFAAVRCKAGPRCTLFTYSASTATRIALLLAGWAVGVGDPTGSKAATTAAACHLADLARPLDRTWLKRLHRPDAPVPSDVPPDWVQIIASLEQFH